MTAHMTRKEAWTLLAFLGIRLGRSLSLRNMPPEFQEKLLPHLEGVHLLEMCKTGVDITLFFTFSKIELLECLPELSRRMSVNGRIWVFFPVDTATEEIPNEDFVRLTALQIGLEDDLRCPSIWGWWGLRLRWRPPSKRLEKPSFRC